MKLIYDIVKKLKKKEIRQLRHTISHASFEFEKVGKLFDLVTRYEEKEEGFYSQKLYGNPPNNTFRVTKSRLKRMLENIILNDKSLSGYSSAAINAQLQVRKKLLQGEILLGRGAYAASKNLLLQVISTAKKYNLQNELFQAELLVYRNYSNRTSVNEFQKHTISLMETNETLFLIHKAKILHYSIKNLLSTKSLKPRQLAEVRITIDQIREICDKTAHPLIKNLYFLSEIYYLQIANQDEAAVAFAYKYLELVQNDKPQFSEQRLAIAYGHLAQTNLRIFRLDEAKKYSDKVLSIFAEDEMNYLRALEFAFRIAFYAHDFKEAQSHIETAYQHPYFAASDAFEGSRILAAKWHYFHASLLFKTHHFKDAYQQLNETGPLLSDKFGMNLHIRLLEIMLMHELEHIDLMETKILNMRQFIKRTQRHEEMMRPITLIRMLMKWYKHNYDFKAALKESQPELDDAWKSQRVKSTDFELIRLEHWMKEKALS